MKAPILGFDVGGANLKVVRLENGEHALPTLLELPFPLWREHRRLPVVLTEAAAVLGGASTMAVTMTAELADCFSTKREGVGFVLDAFRQAFPKCDIQVYGVDGLFRTPGDAVNHPALVAAANWMASATLVGRSFPDALFVDVGSTTTDIIPITGGRVAARGKTIQPGSKPASSFTLAPFAHPSARWCATCRCAAGRAGLPLSILRLLLMCISG